MAKRYSIGQEETVELCDGACVSMQYYESYEEPQYSVDKDGEGVMITREEVKELAEAAGFKVSE